MVSLQLTDEQFGEEVKFLQRLVQTNSCNPFTSDSSPADAPVEAAVATRITEQMYLFGWQPHLYGVSEQRKNVVCTRGNKSDGKTLILNIHMDTVPASAAYTRDPWGAEIDGGKLYGVGVADGKAQIAAFMYAVRTLEFAGIELGGRVKLAFVVDEETGASSPYGTHFLLEQGLLDGDAAIVGEPGNSKIAIGHRGVYRFCIRTYGDAIHTGLKEWEQGTRGHNAVVDMSQIIHALFTCPLPNTSSTAFPGRKNVITFPTIITGGSGVNIVPEMCKAYGDIRLLPPLSLADVRLAIEEHLASINIAYQLQDVVFVPAVETAQGADIVKVLAKSVEEITGSRPRLEGAGPACDGWMFSTRGIDTICGYGVTCGGVHGADEWIDLDSLRQITTIYAQTILSYLGRV